MLVAVVELERLRRRDQRIRRQFLGRAIREMQGAYVVAVEERLGVLVARVAHRPDALTVRGRHGRAERLRDPVLGARPLDPGDHARERGRWVVVESVGQRQVEAELGVGVALDVRVELGRDVERQVAPHLLEAVDLPVELVQPTAVTEGMAVGARAGAADRRTHVCQEHRRLDLLAEVVEVRVVPGRADVPVLAGEVAAPVPADAEPVAVRRQRVSAEQVHRLLTGDVVLPCHPALVDE